LEIKDHEHTLSSGAREMHTILWYESLEEMTLKILPTWEHIIRHLRNRIGGCGQEQSGVEHRRIIVLEDTGQ